MAQWSRHPVPEVAGLGSDDELVSALIELGVGFDEHEALLAAARQFRSDPDRHRALRWAAGCLVAPIGVLSSATMEPIPSLVDPEGIPDGFSDVLAAVLASPHTRAEFARLAISDQVARQSLADLGRNVLIHRRQHGRSGYTDQEWLQRHFAGRLVELGRLQFELSSQGSSYTALINRHAPGTTDPGDAVLSLHIPRYAGSLSAARVDQALELARVHFARHRPDLVIRHIRCTSWLLDPQLDQVLPAGANITEFAHRFIRPVPGEDNDEAALRFVFEDPTLPLAEYPRDTSLQRGIVDHLQAGGHWREVPGWFTVDWS